MGKTKIEWCDYSINPIKGLCPVDCKDTQGKSYCYARRMYKRFKWNPEIRITPLFDVRVPEGSRIFVGSTIELFGPWIKPEWLTYIFQWVSCHPKHTFIFLTKQPQNLPKEFPDNCWVGVSATNVQMYDSAIFYLNNIHARVKYISLEPLLGSVKPDVLDAMPHVLNWVIIGLETPYSKKTAPRIEWVKEIVEACDKSKIPVFLKNNIFQVFVDAKQSIRLPDWAKDNNIGGLRQELPK